MNLSDVKKVMSAVAYKNDWFFFVKQYRGQMYLQVEFLARDTVKGAMMLHKGRKWFISKHATRSEIVFTALKAVLTAEEHEAREQFTYHHRAIGNPHVNVDQLWIIANTTDHRS